MELGFSKFQAYKPQPLALRVFKIPENSSDNVSCRVSFHRSRGVQGHYSIAALSSEQHFEKLPKILKRDSSMDVLLGSCRKYSK